MHFYKKQFVVAFFMLVTVVILVPNVLLSQGYNLKLGPVYFNLTGALELEYQDNLNRSPDSPESDFIISPGLNLAGNWEITRFNTLSFDLGLRYKKYINHPELDSSHNFITILPDSTVAFKVFVSNFTINFMDKVDFSSDATDVTVLNDETSQIETSLFRFSRLKNKAIVKVDWDISSRWDAEVSATRLDVIPLDDIYDSTDRTTWIYSVGVYRQFTSNFRLGGIASYSETKYKINFQNDSHGDSYGLVADWKVSEYLNLRSGVNWVHTRFEGNGANLDYDNSDGITYNITAEHSLNSFYAHSLSFSRSVELGYVNNYTEMDTLQYSFIFNGFRDITFSGDVRYRKATESAGAFLDDGTREESENYDRWEFQLKAEKTWSPKFRSEIGYGHTTKSSSVNSRNYSGNRYWIGLYYDF